jgi:hypothetical protein
MLMKLSPGVIFTSILQAAFLYNNVLHSFSLIRVWQVIFWQKNIEEYKLIAGVNFMNVLLAALTLIDSESVKKYS